MKCAFLALVMLVGYAPVALADIAFTLSPVSQSVPQGTPAVFNLFLNSTTGNQNVAGVDLGVTAGNGASDGIFTSGSTLILGGTAPALFLGTAFLSTNQVGGMTIGASQVQLGTLTLGTSGVAFGTYFASFDPGTLFAVDSGNVSLPVLYGAQVQYSVTAVPEPTSILTAMSLGMGALFYRRKRGQLSV